MKDGGRERRGENAHWISVVALVASLLFAGCSLLNLGGDSGSAGMGAHAVVFARPTCTTFVARSLGRAFLVAEVPGGDYAPAEGDVFEGPSREGRSVFGLFPVGSTDAGDPEAAPSALVSLDVRALGLTLSDARARFEAACPAR